MIEAFFVKSKPLVSPLEYKELCNCFGKRFLNKCGAVLHFILNSSCE